MSEFISQLNQIGGWFCEHASAMLLQVSVLIAILFVLDAVLRRHVRAVVRYWLWMLVLVKLVLPVSLSSPTGLGYWVLRGRPEAELSRREIAVRPVTTAVAIPPVENEGYARPYPNHGLPPAAPEQGPPEAALQGPTSLGASKVATGIEAPDPPALPSWHLGFFWGWLAGVLFLGIWVVRRSRFVQRLVRHAEPADRQIVQILHDCRGRLNVRRPVRVGISAETAAPAVCGLLRPTIVLPAGFSEQVSSRQLKAVLMHELAHVQRGDLAVNLIQTVLQVVYFYNPLVWLANTMIRRVREKAIDEAVLVALGEEAPQYSSTLLDVAERVFRRPVPGLSFVGVAESRRALAGRIRHIVGRPLPRTARVGVAGFACVIALAAMLLPMAAAEPPAAKLPQGEEGSTARGKPTDDASGLPASRSRKPLGPVPPYATRAEGKLEFDKKIDLHFPHAPIATSPIVLGNSTPSILFSNREGRVVAQLPIDIHPEFGGTWWVHVGLLDDAGKIVAADEQQYTMEETVRMRDLQLIVPNLTHTLDFDLGSWKERSVATRFAVTVEQYPPLIATQLKVQPGRSANRQQPFKLEEPAKIDLRHRSGAVVQWVVFRHERDRLHGKLHVSYPSGPKAAWKAGVELLDEAGKTRAAGERRFDNDGLVRNRLAFVRLKAFEFDFGPREDVSNVKRVAVDIEELAPGDNSETDAPGTRGADRAAEVPSPAELLAKLKAADALYRQGLTVAGTSVYGWPKTKHEWRLSTGNGQVALLQRAAEILDKKENRDHPVLEKLRNETLIPAVFPMVMLENAVFVTPEYCACRWRQKNPPVDLPEPGGYRLIYFMSVTSALYTREALWVMGRGLPEHIQEITQVSRNSDGTLKAAVTTDIGTGPWELTIEPEADWMIRSGKGRYCTFSNSGLKWIGERCIPSKGIWNAGGPGGKRAVTFERASTEPDHKFLQDVEEMMHPPYSTFMSLRDERVWPPLAAEARRPKQTILPIRCKGIGHPDGKKKFEARQAAPRQAAEQFLAAFPKGNEGAVSDLIAPGSRALGDLAGLRKAIGDAAALEVRGVRFAGERAVILTTDIPLGSDPVLKAPVFLRLAKHADRWRVDRIESRLEEPFTRRLTRVLSERD